MAFITGGAGRDVLSGGNGNDLVEGLGGDDQLQGDVGDGGHARISAHDPIAAQRSRRGPGPPAAGRAGEDGVVDGTPRPQAATEGALRGACAPAPLDVAGALALTYEKRRRPTSNSHRRDG